MGTDIHLAVERRDKDGRWHRVPDPIRACPDYLHDKSVEPDAKTCYWCKGTGKRSESFYPHRDYDVFAILADVRNGRGFAGCVTGDGFEILSEPRGFPNDLSPELAKAARHSEGELDDELGDDEMWFGDHSFSWLTVDEILRGNVSVTNPDCPCYWLLETKHRGVVGPAEYLKWKRDGRPSGWSGDVSGSMVRKVTPAEMGALILAGKIKVDETDKPSTFGDSSKAEDGFHYVTTVEWTETYAEAAKFFLEMVYKDLLPLGHPRDTRIVFGFDS